MIFSSCIISLLNQHYNFLVLFEAWCCAMCFCVKLCVVLEQNSLKRQIELEKLM
jgi:hypothetical protein